MNESDAGVAGLADPTLLDWLRDGFDDEVTPLASRSRGMTGLRATRVAAAMPAI